MSDFNELLHKAVQERLEFISRNREWLVEMFVAQHGFNPDEMQLVEKQESDGSVRVWVEKRGEYAELTRLRAEVEQWRRSRIVDESSEK